MRALPLLLGVLIPLAAAQDLTSTFSSYPSCAQTCILKAFTAQLCSPLNSTCICNDLQFRNTVTDCVVSSCTVIESLSTQNISLSSCGAPVRDHSHQLIVLSFTMFAFAALLALIRILYKLFMKLDLGLDDWLLSATTLTIIPQLVILMKGTIPSGIGKDMWTLTADQITNFLRYWYVVAIMYFLQTTLIKLAFVAFYMRIFTTRSTNRLLWATFVFITCWGMTFIFLGIFVCTPISYLWTQWDGLHQGKCVSDAAYVWANAISNIALDFWVLAIPLWELRKLQLHWKKKVGVAVMFCLGACVTVMSILRLKSLFLYTRKDNVTRALGEIYLWSCIEMGVGIMCACLPVVRLLLVKLWPVLAGTTVRDSNKWYRQSGKDSQVSRTTRSLSSKPLPPTPTYGIKGISRSVTINGKDVPARGGIHDGISVEETFEMEHQQRSDISLILMKPHSPV